jgi:Ca2+-binding EF-hand superfamily protein
MVSQLVNQKFTALLLAYAEAERKVEVTRQVLVDQPGFDAYAAFARITSEHLGGLTVPELGKFLTECGTPYTKDDLDLLFIHLDFDADGLVSWPEFLDATLSREYHNAYQYGNSNKLNAELEISLARVFEQEMTNERSLEDLRKAVWELGDLKEGALFDQLDVERKGWLSLQDFSNFIGLTDPDMKFVDIERCFRRVDEDNDDRVLFDEFVRTIRPVYCYKYYEHYIPKGREMSPTKIYQKVHEPAPLRKGDKKTVGQKIVGIDKKAVRERTKAMVEVNRTQGNSEKFQDLYVSTSSGPDRNNQDSQTRIRSRGALDPFHDYAYRGFYPDYARGWENQGPPPEMMWGSGMGCGDAGPWSHMRNPMMNGGWEYWKDAPSMNTAARRVEKSHLNDELFKSKMAMSPARGEMLKQRALELSPSRHRRPYYYERYGTPDGSACKLKDSTMAGISSLREEAQEHPEESQSGMLKSVIIGDRSVITAGQQEPGSALLRSEYLGSKKVDNNGYNETPLVEDYTLDGYNALNESPECPRARFVANVRECLDDVKLIEEKRKNLAMRFDFCLTEVFGQIDVDKTGYVGINELDDWSTAGHIQINREDWAMILDRYDHSKDGKFNFTEFCQLWHPWTANY